MFDDTKFDGKVQALNQLTDWINKSLLSFKIDKRKVLHIDNQNQKRKHLGVTMNCNLKKSGQCKVIKKKVLMFGILSRNVDNKSLDIM